MSFVRNYYEGQNKIQPPKAKAVVVCHRLSENDEIMFILLLMGRKF